MMTVLLPFGEIEKRFFNMSEVEQDSGPKLLIAQARTEFRQ